MPARDVVHQVVKRALQKEDWIITHDPLFISLAQVEMFVDLGAEKVIAAEKQGRKIAVEIKSFLGSSTITEFYMALGKFNSYQLVLELQQPERILYLAVPVAVYDEFFQLEFGQLAIRRYQLRLIVYDAESEVIVQWVE